MTHTDDAVLRAIGRRIAGALEIGLADLLSAVPLQEPARPHDVRIEAVLEVCCLTCGGRVLAVTDSKSLAAKSKAEHVAATLVRGADR